MNFIKFVRIFLLILIIIGIGLLLTQKMWVSKVVDMILGPQVVDQQDYTNPETKLVQDRPYVKYDFIKERENFEFKRTQEYFPPEMADYLEKYIMCTHWSGEDGYDEERGNQIELGIKENCIDFDQAEKNIKDKYESDPIFSIFLTTKQEVENGESGSFVYDDPKKQSIVLNRYFEAMGQYVAEEVSKDMKEYGTADVKEKANLEYLLSVQNGYLLLLIPEINRLHPTTKKAIEDIKNNKEFRVLAGKNTLPL